jgi:hypothetical protein
MDNEISTTATPNIAATDAAIDARELTDDEPNIKRTWRDDLRSKLRERNQRTNDEEETEPILQSDENQSDTVEPPEAEKSSIRFRIGTSQGIPSSTFIPAFQLFSQFLAAKWGEACRLQDFEITNWASALANVLQHVPIAVEAKGLAASVLAFGMVSFQIMYPRYEYHKAVLKVQAEYANGTQQTPLQSRQSNNGNPQPNENAANYATGNVTDFIRHTTEAG